MMVLNTKRPVILNRDLQPLVQTQEDELDCKVTAMTPEKPAREYTVNMNMSPSRSAGRSAASSRLIMADSMVEQGDIVN